MSESNDNFVVNCSDDENYDNNQSNYRLVNGKKVWEPNGQQIGPLYRQLEAKGFIELRWQCPGRRSPSVHNIAIGHKTDNTDNEVNTSDIKPNDLLNEFDFETEFETKTPIIGAKASQPQRRRSAGVKKSQTNLTKVMADIKKYQFIDSHTKKLSIQTSSPSPTTPSTVSMNSQLTAPFGTPLSSPVVTAFSTHSTSIFSPTLTSIASSTPTSSPSQPTTQSMSTSVSINRYIRSDSPTDILQ